MYNVAIVGATGAVGQELLSILAERRFPVAELRLFASPRSAGRAIAWNERSLVVERLSPDAFDGTDIVFFSAGADISLGYVPHAVRAGALAIDNSSAYRMSPDVPLVVPEVNAQAALRHRGIIANPNCSTILLAAVLWPLHQRRTIRRVVVSTYQAVSGAGARALLELQEQSRAVLDGRAAAPTVFPVQCAFNVFSHDSPVGADGLNREESKMVYETRRILGDPAIQIAPTCVRVPVLRAHTESVSVEFAGPLAPTEARAVLQDAPGVRLVDDPVRNRFPTPIEASGGDEILVGRIRRDPSLPDGRGVQFLCAGDQLRKGAALNAVQIAEWVCACVGCVSAAATERAASARVG